MAAKTCINRVETSGVRDVGLAEPTTLRQYRHDVDLPIVPRIGRLRIAARRGTEARLRIARAASGGHGSEGGRAECAARRERLFTAPGVLA